MRTHLLENLVFFLEVSSPQHNLIFLQSLSLPGSSGGLLVLQALLPILLILGLLGNGVLLPLLDDGLGSQFLHVKVPCLGIEAHTRNCGQSNVLGSKVQFDLELSLSLLLGKVRDKTNMFLKHFRTFSLASLARLDST